jgi:hydroxyethylthiazole kinase-like uncharacterized protein yjeF
MNVPASSPILTVSAMRALERQAEADGTSLSTLMERAGAAVADVVWRAAAGRSILILCGPGNNGGDGYIAARLLAERGANVRVAALAPPATALAKAARAAWNGAVEPMEAATQGAAVLVDAMFGVGMTRPLDPAVMTVLRVLACKAQRRIAVDVPSGVDSDGGALLGGVAADMTIALGALKPAHVLLPAAALCGTTHCAPIGLLAKSPMTALPRWQAIVPDVSDHKYRRGVALVIGGTMPGASALAAMAAARAGAGYVVHAGSAGMLPHAIVTAADASSWLADKRTGAVLIGPGWAGPDDDVMAAWDAGKPLAIDAAAIGAFLRHADGNPLPMPAVMTPHEGEFARHFSGTCGSKIERTLSAARGSGAVIIHKGADTIIAAPDGRVSAAWRGPSVLATAGTGDVLAGAVVAYLARGFDPFDAAVAAVGWHQEQARGQGMGMIADDLVGRP